MWIAVDFDHTIWDSGGTNQPLPGARDALSELRERGYKILIHSCNSPDFIARCLNDADIRFDAIWGSKEGGYREVDYGQKPACALYIDDRGFHFHDWKMDLPNILDRLEE